MCQTLYCFTSVTWYNFQKSMMTYNYKYSKDKEVDNQKTHKIREYVVELGLSPDVWSQNRSLCLYTPMPKNVYWELGTFTYIISCDLYNDPFVVRGIIILVLLMRILMLIRTSLSKFKSHVTFIRDKTVNHVSQLPSQCSFCHMNATLLLI